MDTTDTHILRLLQRDGRLSHEEIARKVHLSRPAVHERIRRMEQDGVIRGYSVHVDWAAVGMPLTAFIWLRTVMPCNPIGQQVLGLTDDTALVEECYRVAGEWCMLVKVRTTSSQALQDLLDRVATVPGVQNTMTVIALSQVEPPLRSSRREVDEEGLETVHSVGEAIRRRRSS